MMALLLAAGLLAQDVAEIPRWIEALSDESFEVRLDAAKRLAAAGRAAIPALKAALDRGDAQRNAAILDVLKEIERRARIEDLSPPCLRLDLSLKDEAVDAALAKAARSFGLEPPEVAPAFAGRKLTLELKSASLWETFDTLSRAAGGEVRGLDHEDGNRLRLEEREDRPFEAHVNVDDVRIIVDTDLGRLPPGKPRESMLRFVLALPPGAWVENARLADVKIALEGRDLAFSGEREEITCVRMRGLPTRIRLGNLYVPMTFPERGPVDVRGVLTLELPEDVEALKPLAGDGRTSLTYPFGKVTSDWSSDSRFYTLTAQGETGDERLAVQFAARDAAGAWICDFPIRMRPAVVFQVGHSEILKEPPARFDGWRVTRTRTRSVPFRLPAVVLTK